MANLQGYTQGAVSNILNHYSRHNGDPAQQKYTYGNQSIDPTRTHLNYALFEREDPQAFIATKIAEVDKKPNRNTNVISDWVITLPQSDKLVGHEREFFEVAYDFAVQAVGGEENVVGAYIHMDETTPHMHFCFVPSCTSIRMRNNKSQPLRWTASDELKNPAHKEGDLKRDNKGTIRYKRVPALDSNGDPILTHSISQSQMFNRKALKEFHPKLSKHMQQHFGFDVGIELDDPGDKLLSRLDFNGYKAAKTTLNKTKRDVKLLTDRREEIKQKTNEEAARLEELQEARAGTEQRVSWLGTLASLCRAAANAALSARGGYYSRIISGCHSIARKLGFDLGKALVDTAQQQLQIHIANSDSNTTRRTLSPTSIKVISATQPQLQKEYTPQI